MCKGDWVIAGMCRGQMWEISIKGPLRNVCKSESVSMGPVWVIYMWYMSVGSWQSCKMVPAIYMWYMSVGSVTVMGDGASWPDPDRSLAGWVDTPYRCEISPDTPHTPNTSLSCADSTGEGGIGQFFLHPMIIILFALGISMPVCDTFCKTCCFSSCLWNNTSCVQKVNIKASWKCVN